MLMDWIFSTEDCASLKVQSKTSEFSEDNSFDFYVFLFLYMFALQF